MINYLKKHAFVIFLFVISIGLSVIWLFPGNLKLVANEKDISEFRIAVGSFSNILYVIITLWLVWETRSMARDALNAQKANNRPQLKADFYLSSQGKVPQTNEFEVSKIDIKSARDSVFSERQGTALYLVISNLDGGGKALDVKVSTVLETKQNQSKHILDRNFETAYLLPNQAVAIYLDCYVAPNITSNHLNLKKCEIEYKTPFSLVSQYDHEKMNFLENGRKIPILGNDVNSFEIKDGLEKYVYMTENLSQPQTPIDQDVPF